MIIYGKIFVTISLYFSSSYKPLSYLIRQGYARNPQNKTSNISKYHIFAIANKEVTNFSKINKIKYE